MRHSTVTVHKNGQQTAFLCLGSVSGLYKAGVASSDYMKRINIKIDH